MSLVREKVKRSLFESPCSTVKDSKKAKPDRLSVCSGSGSMGDVDSPVRSSDISEMQESIIQKVNDALSIFKSAENDPNDPVARLIPILVTAVSVVVGEVVRGVMSELEHKMTSMIRLQPHPSLHISAQWQLFDS